MPVLLTICNPASLENMSGAAFIRAAVFGVRNRTLRRPFTCILSSAAVRIPDCNGIIYRCLAMMYLPGLRFGINYAIGIAEIAN